MFKQVRRHGFEDGGPANEKNSDPPPLAYLGDMKHNIAQFRYCNYVV